MRDRGVDNLSENRISSWLPNVLGFNHRAHYDHEYNSDILLMPSSVPP